MLGSYFGIKEDGNVPAKNDKHGALNRQVGFGKIKRRVSCQNVLHRDHSIQELGVVFGYSHDDESIVADKIYTALEKLRYHRETTRERPALDDKVCGDQTQAQRLTSDPDKLEWHAGE